MLSSVLADLMPGAPGAARMLVAAAEDRVIELVRDHVAQGLSVEAANRIVAASFARASLYSPDACAWVVEAFAEAAGLVDKPGQEGTSPAEPPTKIIPVDGQETTETAESAPRAIARDGTETITTADPVAEKTETAVRPRFSLIANWPAWKRRKPGTGYADA
jgi:hypothetical protein